MNKEEKYLNLIKNIDALIDGEIDVISKMSTIACELFQTFNNWNWVGFYRKIDERTLKVGPYQGTHGCLTIDIDNGVCGKCAKEQKVQIENDVTKIPHHIPCSVDTRSEIVQPVFYNNDLKAVLDIDSLVLNDFDDIDKKYLQLIASKIY